MAEVATSSSVVTEGRYAGNLVETSGGQTAPVSYGPLSGFIIGVTADRRAEEQSELLARRGAEVVAAPFIRTLPLSDEALLRTATASLISDPPDVVVLSTAIGVRGWFASAEGLGLLDSLRGALSGAMVLARGPKAAGAALTYGVEVDWVTSGSTYSEVIEHLRRTVPTVGSPARPARLALQLDGERSSRLTGQIATIGFDVVPVQVYEWHLPDDLAPAERLMASAAEGSLDAVTFTTGHAVTNFALLAERQGLLHQVVERVTSGTLGIACVGPVTASRAQSIGFGRWVEPAKPRLGAMVQALVADFAGRAVVVDVHAGQMVLQGRNVSVGGGPSVRLTDRERSVLEALARRPGVVVSKQRLVDSVWGGEADDHVVEVTIARLRRRLGSAGSCIETVVRRGYRLTTR